MISQKQPIVKKKRGWFYVRFIVGFILFAVFITYITGKRPNELEVELAYLEKDITLVNNSIRDLPDEVSTTQAILYKNGNKSFKALHPDNTLSHLVVAGTKSFSIYSRTKDGKVNVDICSYKTGDCIYKLSL